MTILTRLVLRILSKIVRRMLTKNTDTFYLFRDVKKENFNWLWRVRTIKVHWKEVPSRYRLILDLFFLLIIENTAKIKLDVFKYNSFEFTERHLEQNREALEVRSQPSSSLQATSGSSQDGSGQLDPTFVSRIASLVQAEITKNKFNEDKKSATLLPVVSNYRSYERSNPLEAVV